MFTIVREFREMVTDRLIDSDDVIELNSETDAVNIATMLNQSYSEIITLDSSITKFTSYVIFSDTLPCIEREKLGFAWEHLLKRMAS